MCVCEYPREHVWVGGAHTRASSHMSAHVMNLQVPRQAVCPYWLRNARAQLWNKKKLQL